MEEVISIINAAKLAEYQVRLREEEKSRATIEKYIRDVKAFAEYSKGQLLSKVLVMEYKEYLKEHYAVSSVNSMLASVNRYLEFAGMTQYKVKQLKQQRKAYCEEEKELSKQEYIRLVQTANNSGKEQLSLILQTICSTGIRISELEYITVSAVSSGAAEVDCKGKSRRIYIPHKLKMLLLAYCRKHKIRSGCVFVTRKGKKVDRSNVWREMKRLCCEAMVDEKKVFPHNLRHLFARTYYRIEKDLSKLADLLGHSSINTTRIYIITSGEEHRRQVERMELIPDV